MKHSSETNQNESSSSLTGLLGHGVEKWTGSTRAVGYLGLAVSGLAASAALMAFAKKRSFGTFIGALAPTLMFIGTYQKFIKDRDPAGQTLH